MNHRVCALVPSKHLRLGCLFRALLIAKSPPPHPLISLHRGYLKVSSTFEDSRTFK